jgi:hypothetical protein
MVGPAVQGNAIPGFGHKLNGQRRQAFSLYNDIFCRPALWTGSRHTLPFGGRPFLKSTVGLP